MIFVSSLSPLTSCLGPHTSTYKLLMDKGRYGAGYHRDHRGHSASQDIIVRISKGSIGYHNDHKGSLGSYDVVGRHRASKGP